MYEGPRLAALFGLDEEEHLHAVAHDVCDEASAWMTDRIAELTPVGHQPYRENYIPGALRESIEQKLVVVIPQPWGVTYESGTETDISYAEHVEHGTGLWGPHRAKYEIRPKNPDGWLRFHDEHGNLIFAKRVMHPGSPGAHMFARGVALTEVELEAIGRRRLRRWEIEGDARWARKGRTDRIRS